MRSLSVADLSWVAGLLEGEGTFGYSGKLSARIRGLRVACAMSDKDVIYRLHCLCSGTVTVRTKQKEHYKESYCWTLSRREDVLNLLAQLLPLMGERRAMRIRNMMEYNEVNPVVRVTKSVGCHCEACQ